MDINLFPGVSNVDSGATATGIMIARIFKCHATK